MERSHRLHAEEFYRLLDGAVEDDAGLLNAKLRKWEDYYTYHRPHGGLGGQTRRTQARRVPPPSVTQLALDAAAVQLAQSGQPRAPSPPPTVHRRRRSPAGPVRISQDRGDALPVDPVEHQRRINYLQRDTPLVGNRARFAMSNAYARTAG
jgi:hypothetical protein